ncbi:flagellar basal body-associated FliL family protein [Roseateles saccharophilus]|uniref:Flagellar protein FliL n=1 Tax=Roseateles saccharophilus TaxID=304 RepID=A0A4R3V660_ROSSA|nr:flagellar basal body-associated FliL family protein [Roseateles saccharophilus]MDG0833767.1 flagellar basal body rod protein [Roseateles saccharophilus]TCU98847.1 flagellar FliL protein [Roseateles saccharophilus]
MATAPAAEGAAPKGGGSKKKLIIIIAAVLVLVLAGGGAALLLLKKKPAEDGEDAADTTEAPVKAKAHAKSDHPPTFVPLDPFTVNLADKDVDRFAQIGITLQVDDPHFADQIKTYMPAIRNNVLVVLSRKTAAELLSVEGKEKLAKDIMRESVRPMGIELDNADEEPAADAPKKKKTKKAAVESPVTQVLFSNFIVQ